MPAGATYVGRPTRWGNPWKVGCTSWTVGPGGFINREPHPPLTAEQAVESYRNSIEHDPDLVAIIRSELGGRDLACWCPLVDGDGNPVPCHADALLEISNGGTNV